MDTEVTIDGGKAPLHAALRIPGGFASGPAVLIIAGSGPTDRNGNSTLPGVQPDTYRLIAEGLAAEGIASLRFDKRAIAASVNHVLKTAPADRAANIATYSDPSLPLGPGVLDPIIAFVKAARPAP
jgi:hypothetical protein